MIDALAAEARPTTLLSTEDAAKRLSVSAACLIAWRSKGVGPQIVRLGRLVRYDVADLDAFVRSSRQTPAA